MNRKQCFNMLWLVSGVCSVYAASELNPGPGFEIQNKAAKPIWVTLINAEEHVVGTESNPDKVAPLPKKDKQDYWSRLSKDIDTDEETELWVWLDDEGNQARAPDRKYKFTTDKTIYLTWDDKGLRPQTGRLKGFAGKTETGYSLENNVGKRDIKFSTPGR